MKKYLFVVFIVLFSSLVAAENDIIRIGDAVLPSGVDPTTVASTKPAVAALKPVVVSVSNQGREYTTAGPTDIRIEFDKELTALPSVLIGVPQAVTSCGTKAVCLTYNVPEDTNDVKTITISGARSGSVAMDTDTKYRVIIRTEESAPADTTPPVCSNARPSGNISQNTQYEIYVGTNERATCYFGPSDTLISSMQEMEKVGLGTGHRYDLFGLAPNTYTYYIKCSDESNNVNTGPCSTISFTIDAPDAEESEPSAVCTDSDGNDIYTKGVVTYQGNEYRDKCEGGNQIEYYCEDSENYRPAFTICPDGYTCDDGVCITTQTTELPSTDPTVESLLGDFDGDCEVGDSDYISFSANMNTENALYDLTDDGIVDFTDFLIFSEQFGKRCDGTTTESTLPTQLVDCQGEIEGCNREISYITRAREAVAKVENGQLYFYHSDHIGSASRITDSTGTVVFSSEYMPFGLDFNVDATVTSKLGFSGKEKDTESNLIYFGARYYDPEVGRFVTVDPMADGINRYIYARNNPLLLKDPDGLEIMTVSEDMKGASFITYSNPLIQGGAPLNYAVKTYEDGKSVAYLLPTEAGQSWENVPMGYATIQLEFSSAHARRGFAAVTEEQVAANLVPQINLAAEAFGGSRGTRSVRLQGGSGSGGSARESLASNNAGESGGWEANSRDKIREQGKNRRTKSTFDKRAFDKTIASLKKDDDWGSGWGQAVLGSLGDAYDAVSNLQGNQWGNGEGVFNSRKG